MTSQLPTVLDVAVAAPTQHLGLVHGHCPMNPSLWRSLLSFNDLGLVVDPVQIYSHPDYECCTDWLNVD